MFYSLGRFQGCTESTAAPFVQGNSVRPAERKETEHCIQGCASLLLSSEESSRLASYLFCAFPQLWLGPSDECFALAPSAAQSVCCQQLMKSLARRHPLGKSRAMNRPVTCISGCNALSAAFAVPPSPMIVPLLSNGLSLWSNFYSQCQKRCLSFWQGCGAQWALLRCPQ